MVKKIQVVKSTPLFTNNYLVFINGGAILIEASISVDKIKEMLGEEKLLGVFLTHSHFDHAINLEAILKTFQVPCFMTKKCYEKIHNYQKTFYGDKSFKVNDCEDFINFVNDKDVIKIGENEFEVLFTPGHTDDSVCLILGDNIFTGDTLFYDGIGRTDLPTGNFEDIKSSLKKLFDLDKNLKVYPGHGDITSINREKKNWEGEI